MNISETQIVVDGLEVNVVRKGIKNIHLRIEPPHGRVRMAVPLRIGEDAIRRIVSRKLKWIKRHQARFQTMVRQTQPEMIDGESHEVLGQRYFLNVSERSGRGKIVLHHESLVMELYVAPGSHPDQRWEILQRWYHDQLRLLVSPLFEKWAPRLGVQVSQWGIKRMKTRWGSCNPRAQRIWLNLELAKKSITCIEYVVVHELVHLVERGHNQRFKKIMDTLLPQWRLQRNELIRVVQGKNPIS